MHDNLSLDDLIDGVLQEIGKFGLGSATFIHYRRTYDRFKKFAARRSADSFSTSLIEGFLRGC